MSAETVVPVPEGFFDAAEEERHLQVVAAVGRAVFDESFYIQPRWLEDLQPIPNEDSWRVDCHAEGADWVLEHSLAATELSLVPPVAAAA